MTFDELLDNLYLFDFEVTAFDYLLVIKNYKTNEEIIFHNATPNEVYEFIKQQPILLGHNARYYDQYILKAILSSYTIEEIKKINDYIISGGQGFEIQYDFDEPLFVWDTMQDIVPAKSLKEIEANLLLDITESTISFNIDHQWTKEEYEEMLYYCRHDVDALRPLFEARKGYFETKFDICKLCNIDPKLNIGLTNAKLCAKFLEARMVKRNDERDYVLPKTIDTKYIDKRILDFFYRIYDESIPSEELFKTKLEYEEHSMPTVISWGGKHGAIPNFIFIQEEEPDMVLINADFESLYPHLLALEEYNTISRNIKDSKAYYNTLQNRLKLKHEGKKKEQLALKLILNTTYGCELNQYNDLYDPKGARSTCINGQLLISELTERIYEIGDVTLVQVNTDGIMVKLPKNKLEEYYKVCEEFSKKVKINLEFDIIEKIIQRDVNNYILYMKDKDHYKIKAKGGAFSNLPNLSMDLDKNITSEYVPNFKTNSMAIVSEALARYLLVGTPVEETINNCNNIHEFQQVSHLGSTYEKCVQESPNGDIELQRNNRIYASNVPRGTIVKVKSDGRRDSLANCPTNPIVDNKNELSIDDINKKWYIDYAQQMVEDFLGTGKQILKGRKKLMKKDELIAENEELKKQIEELEKNETRVVENDYVKLLRKINEFRKAVQAHEFILDKAMDSKLGGGEYVSIGQFYNFIQQTCPKLGLDFSFEPIEEIRFERDIFKPSVGATRHLSEVRCIATFTDLDTGLEKRYQVIGSGSDSIDKSLSGAETLAFRNWFKFNFTPKEKFDWDEEGDTPTEISESKEVKVPTYIPPQVKEEIKEKVVTTEQHESSDDEDIEKIADMIMKIREAKKDDSYGEEVVDMLQKGLLQTAEIDAIRIKIENTFFDLGLGA